MNICIIHIKYTYAHASTEYHIILIKVNIKFGQLGCKNKNKTADMFKKKLKKWLSRKTQQFHCNSAS